MEFDHIAIHVVDLAKSVAFYEKVMGLTQIPEPFQDNRHIWFKIGLAASLHVVGGATAVSEHSIDVHMAFRAGSLDEFMALLDQEHVSYRSFAGDAKVAARPDGIRQIYFQDPDGYWIEVNDAKP